MQTLKDNMKWNVGSVLSFRMKLFGVDISYNEPPREQIKLAEQ